MKVWEFVKVEKDSFDTGADTAPNASYSYSVKEQGSNWVMSSGITYQELEPLLPIFEVGRPEDLVGKSFQSPAQDFQSAISLLITQVQHEIKHGTPYIPPTEEDLYERAAVALGNMECPDFSEVDDETVFNAFHNAFDFFHANEDWLHRFQERIHELSEGTVQLQKTRIEDFSIRIKGPAEYLLLVRGEQTQRVTLGPYSTPVSFD